MSSSTVVGLAIMIVSEACTLARIEPFWSWNTPICWTGFILCADGVVRRARGDSWLSSSPREFAFLALVSIPLWVVFEGYNLVIRNWNYVGLPANVWLRYFGYAWSFATISPALFEGAELVGVLRGHATRKIAATIAADARPRRLDGRDWLLVAIGVVMLLCPFVVSPAAARYLAAPVWLGFIFLLDPVNDALGFESILGDWRRGATVRLTNLLLSGLLCGALWEFWNYWSRSKWHYTVPIMENLKIFEMPLPGYLGFPPFAIECFAMYVLVRGLFARAAGLNRAPGRLRPVGL
jgi:hypothetical protein